VDLQVLLSIGEKIPTVTPPYPALSLLLAAPPTSLTIVTAMQKKISAAQLAHYQLLMSALFQWQWFECQ